MIWWSNPYLKKISYLCHHYKFPTILINLNMPSQSDIFDIAVVGQGIAGTMMAWFLYNSGKKVLIIDDNFNGSSSKIAAGIVNPITGKNFVCSWRIHDFLPVAIHTYDNLSKYLGIETYVKANIVRALYSAVDENTWLSKSCDPLLQKFMMPLADISEFEGKVKQQFSYGELRGTFYVRMAEIMEAFRDKWLINDQYLMEKFHYQSLEIKNDGYEYKKFKFQEIVFCEGYQALNNPFFKEIGLAPSKGEVLIIRIPGAPFVKMYKDGVFIVHQKDDQYWVGSGYEWNTLDDQPTPKLYEELYEAIMVILNVPFEVIAHQAGIRPTMFNRRPVFKVHPEHHRMYLFNGLGTKGASIAPFAAKQFARYIVSKNLEDLVLK